VVVGMVVNNGDKDGSAGGENGGKDGSGSDGGQGGGMVVLLSMVVEVVGEYYKNIRVWLARKGLG